MLKLLKKGLRFYFSLRGLEVGGLANLPSGGGFIIACNHVSFWDPIVVWASLARDVHFMAKAELFRWPIVRAVIRLAGAFPVRRGESDRRAVRRALEILGNGGAVVVFVPGTRVKEGQNPTPKPGVAMLATKAKVPVVPVAITGTRHLVLRRRNGEKLRVCFGEPVSFDSCDSLSRHQHYDSVTRSIWNRITSLLDRFKPSKAGRSKDCVSAGD